MLVVGTFAEEDRRDYARRDRTFAEIRWMRIDEYLKAEVAAGRTPVTRIPFKGERLDRDSILRLRAELLHPAP
ncbi:MAG: hypothetical protein HZB16_24520 [Armatimonadetes bacterium]|nr:hypothetical protein [Armatimonadota bacterium]